MKIKLWPCGTERGNPWHYDCKGKRCSRKAKETGEGLGVNCVRLRRRRRGKHGIKG